MSLIPIADNILINPEYIVSVSKRLVSGKETINVKMVNGDSHVINRDFKNFMETIGKISIDLSKQFTSV